MLASFMGFRSQMRPNKTHNNAMQTHSNMQHSFVVKHLQSTRIQEGKRSKTKQKGQPYNGTNVTIKPTNKLRGQCAASNTAQKHGLWTLGWFNISEKQVECPMATVTKYLGPLRRFK